MRRDVRKAVKDYEKLSRHNKANIYLSDVSQIIEMCSGDIIKMIMIGIQVGIVIGYRLAKSEKHS